MSEVFDTINLDETLDKQLDPAPECNTAEHPLMLIGGDSAILGTTLVFAHCKDGGGYQQTVVVYDLEKLADDMHEENHKSEQSACHDDCTGRDDALEFYEYNYLRYPAGKNAPLFLVRHTAEEINDAFALEPDAWQG
jgi:hypothetical protein